MTISLAKHSLAELRQLANEVKLELARRDQQRIIDARNQVYAIAKSLGLSVQDLLGKHSKDTGEQEQNVSMYRHSDSPQQVWSGRGRRPRWVIKWLAEGRALADLAVGAGWRQP